MAEGVRGAQQHFEREVRGLRTQVVAGVESMVRSADVVKRETRGCVQMVGRVGEKVEVAVGCVQAECCAQLGRVEARVGEVEWAVREQWDARHRELVAQVRGLARMVFVSQGPIPQARRRRACWRRASEGAGISHFCKTIRYRPSRRPAG